MRSIPVRPSTLERSFQHNALYAKLRTPRGVLLLRVENLIEAKSCFVCSCLLISNLLFLVLSSSGPMTYTGMWARQSNKRDTRQAHLNSLPKNPPSATNKDSRNEVSGSSVRALRVDRASEVVRPEVPPPSPPARVTSGEKGRTWAKWIYVVHVVPEVRIRGRKARSRCGDHFSGS